MWSERWRRVLAIAVIATCAAAAAIAIADAPTAPPARSRAYADTLAAGAGHDIATRSCVICHSPMLIAQQHKDSTGWEKTLATMQKWGAPLTSAEHDTLARYLISRYGPKGTH